tara:strand:- start:3553 stop:4599 length:1047 start_codon:yes stop_codon:yes gene_type:complete
MVKGDYTVYLKVIDSYVYDFDQNVVDIIYGLQNYDRVILDLKVESPDFTKLGITDTLEKIISTYNVPYGKLVLKTGNMIEQCKLVQVEIVNSAELAKNVSMYRNELNLMFDTPDIKKEIQKHFGIYIGRSNYARLALASYLEHYYGDITDLTFHCDPTSDYHKSHIGLDQLFHNFGTRHPISRAATQFIHKIPITKDVITAYPIAHSTPLYGLADAYSNIFLDIVCETMSTGDTFNRWTEKGKRAVMFKTPFLLFGPRNFLGNIKKLGYKTFEPWWNESYDHSEGAQRVNEITSIIDYLAKKPLSEIISMYGDMQDVLEYNRELMLEHTRNFTKLNYDEFKKQFSVGS